MEVTSIHNLVHDLPGFEVITKDNGDLIDLVDFLKLKLSSEDQQLFVDSFALYLSSRDDFCVNLEFAVQWLHVPRKQQLVEKLGDSAAFTKGVDYKVFTSKGDNPSGGRPTQQYIMKPSVFERLCLSINTPRGREVQQYYITMMNCVKDYVAMQAIHRHQQQEQTLCELQTKMRLIEETSNLEKEKSREQTLLEAFDKKSVVYAGRAGEEDGFDIIKFGSTDDIKQRTRDHKRSIGDHYVVQLVVESVQNRELERQLKDNPQIIARRLKREINGRTQTELIKLDERFGINDCRDVLHRISQTLFIDKEYANMKHRERMAEIELKQQQEKTKQVQLQSKRRAEIEVKMAELQFGVKKAEIELKKQQVELKRLQLQKECLELRLELKSKHIEGDDLEDGDHLGTTDTTDNTNDPYRGFINNGCEPVAVEDERGWIPVAEFYERFKTWCNENGFAEDARLHKNQVAKKFSKLVDRRNMNKAGFKGNHIRGLRFTD
ncbi:hypothetical protein HK102_008145 [Quaeritorhiza haematococci]|nr:hypothetical protein HK102_008145 [Quaeritorhiza haematococci]